MLRKWLLNASYFFSLLLIKHFSLKYSNGMNKSRWIKLYAVVSDSICFVVDFDFFCINHKINDQTRKTLYEIWTYPTSYNENFPSHQQPQFCICRYNILKAEKVFPLPQIADSITEGTIAEFTKKEGEWVELDETIANVETDKVTV